MGKHIVKLFLLRGLRRGDPTKPVLTVRLFAHRAEVKADAELGNLAEFT